jgi:hypothetical protein
MAPTLFPFSPRRLGGLLAMGLLAGMTTVAFLSDWTLPERLEGDPLEVYARVKLAREHPAEWLLNGSQFGALGQPGPADWRGYPMPDRLVFFLTGQLSWALGLIPAVQLMSCLIIGLNAVSFYLCARWLRCRREWALALAVVFACCNYNVRWGVTLSLGQTFLLPPLVLLCAHASRRGAAQGDRRWWWLAGLGGAWIGLGNPYHAYFAGVVGGGALLLALIRRVPRVRFMPLILLLGTMGAVFLANHAALLLPSRHGGEAPALVRDLNGLRVYALRPLDWIVPPNDHRLPSFARWGVRYHEWRRFEGEFFYNYLGIAGLFGLLLVGWLAVRRLWRRQWHRLDPACGLGWITAFGIVGGFNYWLGTAGMDLFRASNRIGIYAHVFIGLVLCGWLSRRSCGLPRTVSILLACLFGIAACWENTLPLAERGYPANHSARWNKYERLTQQLEQTLPAGSAVFQLPALPFPEAGRHYNLPDYEHLLPYLTSTDLRFSYGVLRHDPKLRWALYLESLPAASMIASLESAGFAALWIDERGYRDSARALLTQLRATGRIAWPPDEALPYLHLFLLRPAAQPLAPDLQDPRLAEPWGATGAGSPGLRALALQGWYPSEQSAESSWRWAARQAALGFWHDGPPIAATLQFRVDALPASQIVIHREGVEIWRGKPGPNPHRLTLTLEQGLNRLVWSLDGRTFRPGDHDPRELGFMVENLSLSVP